MRSRFNALALLLSSQALAANKNPITVDQMTIFVNKIAKDVTARGTYTAGTAISIIDNIISGAYTPGAGIDITDAEISATPYTASAGLKMDGFDIQGYQAGTNITINTTTEPSTISAAGPTTVAIGDLYQGGIVFYVDVTGQHGLVAALSEDSRGTTSPYVPIANAILAAYSKYGMGGGF